MGNKLITFMLCFSSIGLIGGAVFFSILTLTGIALWLETIIAGVVDPEVWFDVFFAACAVVSLPLLFYFDRKARKSLGERPGFDIFEPSYASVYFGLSFGFSAVALAAIPNIVFMSLGDAHFNISCDVDCQLWFLADNLLKIILLDFLEIFNIGFSPVEPISMLGRTIVFLYRILISYTLIHYFLIAYRSAQFTISRFPT